MSDDLMKRADSFRLWASPTPDDVNEANWLIDRMSVRIEELEAKLFSCATDLDIYMSAHASLEAKLAKAVEALDKIKRIDNLVGVFAACERTLAELTGGKNA